MTMQRSRPIRRRPWPRCPAGVAGALLALGLATAAQAQDLSFSVGNFSLEQLVVANGQNPYTATLPNGLGSAESTNRSATSIIVQQGSGNRASAYSTNSPGAALASIQLGQSNRAVGVIEDSPGSTIAQAQFGSNNDSLVGILRGADNAVSTVQLGDGLGASVALVDSTSTTVVYGQAGQNYNGGIVIRNAPPGTVVKLN
ncbi:hypothetical protein [Actibacterium sp. MT2.3-13A]|uniref:hypothetical protein n=1 Tax=Actibacterium sp. MT2.3-13A TaxID=2828332 RepID=UPI001BABFB93|nr:hypothetical protein [Actibacterium sp. MT2.3-13A]